MRNNLLGTVYLLVLIGVGSGCGNPLPRACLREACYKLEVVSTEQEREHGLMFRQGLKPGTGMFFVFDKEDIYTFWMKNMAFFIDIIWLDQDKRVVHIADHVPPCSTKDCPVYTPAKKARFVLEVPAGDASKYGIVKGDLLHGQGSFFKF